MEQKKSYKENLYLSIFDTIKDCVAIYEAYEDGEDFLFAGFNPSAEIAENINRKDILGKKLTEVFPAVKDFGILDAFRRVYKTGKSENFPLSFYEDDRISGWRDNYIYKIDEKHIIAVYNDVTQAKQAEAELKLSAKVFDNSLEGMMITNERTKIVKVNSTFLNISGYTEEEALNSYANLLKSDLHDDAFYQELWREIHTKGSWQGEIWNRRKDGEVFAVFSHITAVRDGGKVKNYVAMYLDITEKLKAQEYINKLSYTDLLTKLPNRTLFDIELDGFVKRGIKDKMSFALLALDIDNFKYINDSFGHSIGDNLLKEITEKLKTVVRDADFIARVGGDEFVIIVDNVEFDEEIGLLCKDILSLFDEPFKIGINKINLGTSIGISVFPNDGDNKEQLLRSADTALYKAKEIGKNRFLFHTPQMNKDVSKKLELDEFLRETITNEGFDVFYQPKSCFQQGKFVGAEALIRWNHPKLGFVSPLDFIPYAEESGLIIPIGNLVLKRVCEKISFLEKQGICVRIAVNISSVQLDEDDFVENVQAILREKECNTKYLEFEVTESKIMNNVEVNIKKLTEIKKLGIKISIDDFGTGYSSMSYLQKLPVDTIKIDKSFIDNVPNSEDGNLIVKGILALTKGLSLETVAEGVETQEQKDFLKENGCDILQGYLYSKPLGDDDFAKFVEGIADCS